MHAEAERTDREHFPSLVAALLDRNDQRHADRAWAWRPQSAQTRAREAAYRRFTTTTTTPCSRRLSANAAAVCTRVTNSNYDHIRDT